MAIQAQIQETRIPTRAMPRPRSPRCAAPPLEDTRMENPKLQARAVVVLDPEGTRLELIEAPGDPPVGEPLS